MDFSKLQATEALERMKILKLHHNVKQDFKHGVLNRSDDFGSPFCGILYWLDEAQQRIVKDFETEIGAMVYHATLQTVSIGGETMQMFSLLYVSKHQEEWDSDQEMLKDGECYAFVYNVTNPDLSEIGLIGVEPANGGVRRVW